MKNHLLFIAANVVTINFAFSQGTAINIAGAPADNSAILDIGSTSHGILIPRMSSAERDDIPLPAVGLLIYNTGTNTYNLYKSAGWHELSGAFVSGTTGTNSSGGGAAINLTGTAAFNSAMLDVSSDSRGILIPRTVPASIVSPATGLIIFDNSTENLKYFDGSGWKTACENFITVTVGSGSLTSAGVAINNTGNPPDPSALLDVSSSSMGLLIPGLTTGERDQIMPASGLTIYNTSTDKIEYFNGTTWQSIATSVGAAGAITGSDSVCQGQNGIAFSTGAISNASGYSWQYSGSGFSIASGGNTNSVTADFSSGATSGDLSVFGTNACGTGAVSANFAISVKAPPTTATNSSTQTICTTGSPTLSGNNPATGTGSWSVVSGPGTLSTQFGDTAVYNTTFSPAGGAGSYVLRWTISNSPCASSAADATITVNAPPTTAAAGNDINPACGVTTATLAGNTPVTGTGNWSVVSGTATITTPGSPTSGVTGLASAGTATLRWTISNPPCTASTDDVVITTCAAFSCGSNFTDPRDSKVYPTVTVGTQCWFKKNLDYNQSSYGNDWCYNNDNGNCTVYGRLYNWDAVMQGASSSNNIPSGVQGVCPSGWHIPSDAEWDIILNYLGGLFSAGEKMREPGTAHWMSDPGVSNSSGFTGLGSGTYDSMTDNWYEITEGAYWWSSTQYTILTTKAWYRYINYNNYELARWPNPKYYGQSVRCLKD